MTNSPVNLIPYYLTANKLSVSVRQRKDLSEGSLDVEVRVGARVVGDCLVVEPVADICGSSCKACNKYNMGADGLYRGDTCGYLDCGLRLGVLEALGISPDAFGFQNYGWRVSGSPFSMFVKLNRSFKCQVFRLEGEEGDDWTVARVPLIRAEHARMFQTMMLLRSISTSGLDAHRSGWLTEQLCASPYGVTLLCSRMNNLRSNRIARQDVDEVVEILSRARRVVAP